MLCFAGQNVSRMMCGEACLADGFGRRSVLPGSCSDRPRSGTASSGLVSTSWTFKIWIHARTKASFSHLQVLEFEGHLARKLRCHICNFWTLNLKGVAHESFVYTSSPLGIWRTSSTKASFHITRTSLSHPHSHLLGSEGRLARKLRFHICNCWNVKGLSQESFVYTSSPLGIWRDLLHETRFWEIADARNAVFCRTKRVSDDVWGSLSGGRFRKTFGSTGIMLGSAPQWNCQFRLDFHILNFQNLKACSHESFVFTSASVGIWRTSRTKASFSHLQLLEFEDIWRTSRTKASLSDLQLLDPDPAKLVNLVVAKFT